MSCEKGGRELDMDGGLKQYCPLSRTDGGECCGKRYYRPQAVRRGNKKPESSNELILQSAGEGIFGLDLNGNHTFVNSSAAQMLGYRAKELIGKHSHRICHHSKADGSMYPEAECPIYAAYNDGIIRRVKNEVFLEERRYGFPGSLYEHPYHRGQ